jgi:hypothetical protein
MNYEEETALVRKEMKALMIEFNQIVEFKSLRVSRDSSARDELFITANKFAKKYNELQSKYMDLLFLSDLEETLGEEKASLFLKFKMAQNAKNN